MPRLRARQGKIVATLGPGSRSPDVVMQLAVAGVDVFRLNFSHGSHEDHKKSFDAVRRAEEKAGRPLAALADLQGPKVRVGSFPTGKIKLGFNSEWDLVAGRTTDRDDAIPVPHPEILAVLEEGDEILCNDGMLTLIVTRAGEHPRVRSPLPGELSDKKGFTVRGKALPVRALTEKDREDLEFAVSIDIDLVALSFVQTAEDVTSTKKLITNGAPLVSKLEKPAALTNLDAIVDASDAVMVARGDLGVEYPAELVPVLQRRVVRVARAKGKPVIVATQMLESMIDNAAPTRAEASDVATAVYQGADAVMLSAETAVGRHPATAVSIMGRIISAAEQAEDYRDSMEHFTGSSEAIESADIVADAAFKLARFEDAEALALRTGSFRRLAHFARARGTMPMLYGSRDPARLRRAQLLWGVHPIALEDGKHDKDWARVLMEKAGLTGKVAWTAWRGEDDGDVAAWEIGVDAD